MPAGTLYGVSVGPGDPELLTLKAARVIANCPVIAAPRTPAGGMLAFDIVRGAVDIDGKELIPLALSMSRDPQVRHDAHELALTSLRTHLDKGKDVALLSLGDASLYSSFQYFADLLRGEYPIDVVPGVTSFCAAAATAGISLTTMDLPLHILPAAATRTDGRRADSDAVAVGKSDGSDESSREVTLTGTRVLMKSASRLRGVLNELRENGTLDTVVLVQNCGLPDERILRGEDALLAEDSYFTLMIIPPSD